MSFAKQYMIANNFLRHNFYNMYLVVFSKQLDFDLGFYNHIFLMMFPLI